MNELKIAALTKGLNIPSSRFRWEQHIPSLEQAGFQVNTYEAQPVGYPPERIFSRPSWLYKSLRNSLSRVAKANESDICFLQRELISTLYTAERFIKKRIVFDVDDAIFLNQKFNSIEKIAKKSSIIICGNHFIANYFEKFGRIEVLPTAVDTEKFSPSLLSPSSFSKIIGWSGSSSGFNYLYEIEESLNTIIQKNPDVFIKIVSSSPPNFKKIPKEKLIFEKWSAATEASALSNFSIGIMPLKDDLWTKGKCSFKMLTYMASGIPVVVSPYGMNHDILMQGQCGLPAHSSDDWVDSICFLLSNTSMAASMGQEGRKIVESHYSLPLISKKLSTILLS